LFGPSEEFRARVAPIIPAGGPGEPADIAGAVLYLASREASFVVGQILTVDGGATAK
jgi:NAD(P)-dependent dehydrogenase (short-subunit alcohol dehydrogenase family)